MTTLPYETPRPALQTIRPWRRKLLPILTILTLALTALSIYLNFTLLQHYFVAQYNWCGNSAARVEVKITSGIPLLLILPIAATILTHNLGLPAKITRTSTLLALLFWFISSLYVAYYHFT